jgi:nondiscriminating aspartyl-tRNA synthetase
MFLLERMILQIIDTLKEKNQSDIEYLQLQLPSMELPFPKHSYSDIIDKLREAGELIQWGDDISPQIMKSIQHEHLDDFYFIIDWPTSTKPF